MSIWSPLVALALISTALQAAQEPANAIDRHAIDSHALDGCAYDVTIVSKGNLPAAAAGLKPGTTLAFENGRMLFDSGDGGVSRIAFQAVAISNNVARVSTTVPGSLPRAQTLAVNAKSSYIDVAISINGTISNDGKNFSGTLVWDERDDRSPHKVTLQITGIVPQPAAHTVATNHH